MSAPDKLYFSCFKGGQVSLTSSHRRTKHHPPPYGFAVFIVHDNDIHGDFVEELAVFKLMDSDVMLLANV